MIWIAVDADWNDADSLPQSDPVYQVMENFFCLAFVTEVVIRFAAFETKHHVWECNLLSDSSLYRGPVVEKVLVRPRLARTGFGAPRGNVVANTG